MINKDIESENELYKLIKKIANNMLLDGKSEFEVIGYITKVSQKSIYEAVWKQIVINHTTV